MGLYQGVLESADGGAYINLRDGSGTNITSTLVGSKQSVDVNIANSTTIGIADETTFTYGTTNFNPIGGVFQDTSPALSAGQSGSVRLTADRGFHVNLRTSAGVELGNSNTNGVFVKPGDGTNTQSYAATGEAFETIRQGGNVANVNASNQLLVLDGNAGSILSLMSPATGTITTPTVTTSSSTALASNVARKGFSIFNPTTFIIFFAMAATATSSAFTVKVLGNSYFEDMNSRVYTGIITMISPTVTGSPTIAVTEYT